MRVLRLLPIAVLVSLVGCTTMPSPETRYSGFLDDYIRLKDDPEWTKSQYWVKPKFDIKQDYQKRIFLEPPRFYFTDKQLQLGTQRPADVDAMLRYLHRAIRHQFLKAGYEVVDNPQPKTLQLRTAITGAERTPRDMSFSEYIPIGFVVGSAMHLTGKRDESLRIFFESELRDAQSGDLLAQSVSAATGNELSPSTKAKVDDTYPALDAWAKQLRERADKAFASK